MIGTARFASSHASLYVYAVTGRKANSIVNRDVQLKQHCDSENYDAIKTATSGTGHVKCAWIAWVKNITPFYVQEHRWEQCGVYL